MPHKALVYDSARNVFYASIPAAVPNIGNRIAIIDPAAETIEFSAPVGSNPNTLAISSDNSMLYVGLDGSGEVVRFALPAMTEQGRVTLLSHFILGQSTARHIAISPADPAIAAVAMHWSGGSAYVALLRDMILQPKVMDVRSGGDLLVFDSTGTTLYGLVIAFGSNELRQMQVLPDGIAEQATVRSAASGAASLSFGNGRVIAGRALYDAPALTAAGIASAGAHCKPRRSPSQLLCVAFTDFPSGRGRLVLADAQTFVFQDSLLVALTEGAPIEAVEGPAGVVALRYPDGIRLFSSERLDAPPPLPSPSWPAASYSSSAWQIIDIAILHNDLAYDSLRNRYYASIPGYVRGVGNSIATIDPATGAVTLSAPIGSEPRGLAMARDSSFLYVVLDGSGEVIKLALPSMAVRARARLPQDAIFGNQSARMIAVSPAADDVVAVSLARLATLGAPLAFSSSPGVLLLRDMVVQPARLGSVNDLIAFNSDGTALFGKNVSNTEAGLRRSRVIDDGLVQELDVTDVGGTPLGFTNNRVIVGPNVHDPVTLVRIGTIAGARSCFPQRSGSMLLCLANFPSEGEVRVVDSETLAAGTPIRYVPLGSDPGNFVVQGPAHQIAASYSPRDFPMIRLFSSLQLP